MFKDERKAAYLNPDGADKPLKSPLPQCTIEAAREYAINRGHRILNQASNDLAANVEDAARKPLVVDFDVVKAEAKEHLESRAQAQSHEQGQMP